MADTPKSVTITNDEMWIDGAKFPWYIAEEGMRVEVREDYDDLRVSVIHVPILVVEEPEKALAGKLAPSLSGAPIVDLRTPPPKSQVRKVYDANHARSVIRVWPGNGDKSDHRDFLLGDTWDREVWHEAMTWAAENAGRSL